MLKRLNRFSPIQGDRSPSNSTLRHRRNAFLAGLLAVALLAASLTDSLAQGQGRKWVASWATAPQGTLNSQPGSPSPNLSFAFPSFATGAQEQTLRLIIRPDLWSNKARIHLTNEFGTQDVTFGAATAGVQTTAGNIAPSSWAQITFNGGARGITIPAGGEAYSDAFDIPWGDNPDDPQLQGRKLVVSLYVQGTSGPITYHGSAFQTSYISAPGSGDHTEDKDDTAYPYTTISGLFLDRLEVKASPDTVVVAATGASVVDGTASTLNGDDRWADDFSRRLHARYGSKVSVINTGIGGDTAALPPDGAKRSLAQYFQERLDHDVINVAGITHAIVYVGPNDYGTYLLPASATEAAYQSIVARLHTANIKVVGVTFSSSKGDPNGYYGTDEDNDNRLLINDYIRTSGLFDGFADFDAATYEASTGQIKPEFVPQSTTGAAGDYLHPNRAGYLAEAASINLNLFALAADAK